MIRPYTAADLPRVLDIWYRASRVAHPFLSEDFLQQERTAIETEWLPIAETWVLEEGGRIAGYIALIGNVVGAIFVDPDRHRCGIGRQLMDHARRLRGELELEVFEANTIGRAFYERYGFTPAGRSVHEPTGQVMLTMTLPRPGSHDGDPS